MILYGKEKGFKMDCKMRVCDLGYIVDRSEVNIVYIEHSTGFEPDYVDGDWVVESISPINHNTLKVEYSNC